MLFSIYLILILSVTINGNDLGQKSIAYLRTSKKNKPNCYAVFIKQNLILTAASCLDLTQTETHVIETFNNKTVNISYVMRHPEYDDNNINYDVDLAIMKLEKSLDLSDYGMVPLPLPQSYSGEPKSCKIINGVDEEKVTNYYDNCKDLVLNKRTNELLCLLTSDRLRKITGNCMFATGAPIICDDMFFAITPHYECKNPVIEIRAPILFSKLEWISFAEAQLNDTKVKEEYEQIDKLVKNVFEKPKSMTANSIQKLNMNCITCILDLFMFYVVCHIL